LKEDMSGKVASWLQRSVKSPAMSAVQETAEAAAPAAAEAQAEPVVKVHPVGCPSCLDEFEKRNKEFFTAEGERLLKTRAEDITQLVTAIRDYSLEMNRTMRASLAGMRMDVELRNFAWKSSTFPTTFMQKVYDGTLARVPSEEAAYICAPEQATLLRTMVGISRPRRCLDIGSFTGYSSSAILDALLPHDAELTCLERDADYAKLSEEYLRGRNAKVKGGPAIDALHEFEKNGQQFDLISMDADKPMHEEYYNVSLRLLRPGGLMIMFGMIMFPQEEDQIAMEKMHKTLPKDESVMTAQLPIGCGVQIIVNMNGTKPSRPLTDTEKEEHKRWELESELAAIDRYLSEINEEASSGSLHEEAPGLGSQEVSSLALVANGLANMEAFKAQQKELEAQNITEHEG
jgi:predicted O-methyltransferase YrrM